MTLALFLVVDMLWLNVFAHDYYMRTLSTLLLEKPLLSAAVLFYLLYPIGLLVFVIEPGLSGGASAWTVLWKGMFLGVLAYATYDLTNLATLKGWSVLLSAVDILWGGLVSGGVSISPFLIFKRFFA
jgi:uncharacterized membrane protein